MFCRYCGESIQEESKFCHKCGRSVEEVSKTSQDKKNMNKILSYIPMFLPLLAIILMFYILYLLATPKQCDACNEAYYGASYRDPYDPSCIMCEPCTQKYFAGFTYEDYRVD